MTSFCRNIDIRRDAITEACEAPDEISFGLHRLRPQTDSLIRYAFPWKQLAGVDLARRGDVGVGEHPP